PCWNGLRQVLGAISEFDKAMTVAKLRGARERKRREAGKCEGALVIRGPIVIVSVVWRRSSATSTIDSIALCGLQDCPSACQICTYPKAHYRKRHRKDFRDVGPMR